MKNYCETHHLYHKSVVCPFCQREKNEKLLKSNAAKLRKSEAAAINELSQNINEDILSHMLDLGRRNQNEVKPVKKQSDDKPIEITEDVLEKLKNHFKK